MLLVHLWALGMFVQSRSATVSLETKLANVLESLWVHLSWEIRSASCLES